MRVSACLYLQGLVELSLVVGYAAGPVVGGGLQEVHMSVDSSDDCMNTKQYI